MTDLKLRTPLASTIIPVEAEERGEAHRFDRQSEERAVCVCVFRDIKLCAQALWRSQLNLSSRVGPQASMHTAHRQQAHH